MMAASLLAAALLLATVPLQAQEGYYYQARSYGYFQRFDQEPSSAWMMLDTLAARPVGMATTVTGIGLFAGTLPITLVTGTSGDAARGFIEAPARWTFQRRLGRPGFDQHYWLP